ncbi:MAG: hypothetical protein ACI835_004999 [Planctomycetota bacterium]|jgi:hypothetical protein
MKHDISSWQATSIAILTAVALASCSTTPAPRPLPLHAAFLPLIVEEIPSDHQREEVPTVRLDLEAGPIAAQLVNGLQGRGFTLVTNLELPEGALRDRSGSAGNQLWQLQAAALGADVLVRAKVFYEPAIDSSINEKFWLNLPLFLIGGPFCYFIDDRSYEGRARIQAEFFDLTDIHEMLDEDARLLEFPILGEFSGADFDFFDRAGTSVSSYALSTLIPCGLLARNTTAVDSELESEVVNTIVNDLLSKISQLRVEFLNNDLATFHIIERQTIVQRTEAGNVRVAFPIKLSSNSSGLRNFILKVGETELMSGALNQSPDKSGLIWIRSEDLPVSQDEQHLRLRVVDAAGGRRSYTFKIRAVAP